MRLTVAWMAGLSALLLLAGASRAQERLTLEPYPAPSPSAPWRVVTDTDFGGRFYVELMPADQTPGEYRDILAAASLPNVKASAAAVLQKTLDDFAKAQPCEGLNLTTPKTSVEQGVTVAYAQADCGQHTGQTYGTQILYKVLVGAEATYVVSRDFRVPPSKNGGAHEFAEGQQDQALALMKAIGAANVWLANSVYLCGATSKDPRCSKPAPDGSQVLTAGGELDALVKSAAYQRLVGKAVAALPPELTQGCPPVVTARSSVLVLKPVSFDPSGLPIEGAWKQSFPQEGCRGGTVLNFLFTAGADRRIHTLILVPGDGIADPEVQVQAFRAASKAVIASPACGALHVLNTRFEAFDHSKSPGPDPAPGSRVEIPWRETWILGGCGSVWNVPMAFTPQGTATQIAAGPATLQR